MNPNYKRNILTVLLSVSCCLQTSLSMAGNNKVGDFLSDIYTSNTSVNVTGPEAYKGQSAGYYTGGSLVMRESSKQISPMHVSLPKISAGCGGIDAYTGGLSFISGNEFKDMLKSIANGSTGYAVQLALESLSPMMASVSSKLKTVADEVNRFNINSCESASLLTSAVWPKVQTAQRHICAQTATKNGKIEDYVRAKHDCAMEGSYNDSLKNATPEVKRQALHNINITWDALKAQGVVSAAPDRAQWIMSLVGTTIYKAGNPPDKKNYPSLLISNSGDMLKHLLDGGNVNIYRCDSNSDCLNIDETTVTIDKSHALNLRVRDLLGSIQSKIISREKLTIEEVSLTRNVSWPIFKMIDVDTLGKNGQGMIGTGSYSEIIALDWLSSTLTALLSQVSLAAKQSTLPSDALDALSKNIKEAKAIVENEKRRVSTKKQDLHDVLSMINLIEKKRAGMVTSTVGSQFKHQEGV